MVLSKLNFLWMFAVTMAASASAFSTQKQPLHLRNRVQMIPYAPSMLHQSYPVSLRLWGRLSSNNDKGEDDNERMTSNLMGTNNDSVNHNVKFQRDFASIKKSATVAAFAVLGATAFPTLSHAVDLVAEGGGMMSSFVETGFYQAFSLVFLSEIGDKTFFIAGLLAMKTSRFVAYLGSMGALTVMTILSVLIGQIFHAVPSGLSGGLPLDDIAACLAFAFFGVKTIKDALDLEAGESVMDEEFAEAEETVDENSSIFNSSAWGQFASIFALVFAAEFGDRSFLSTIALSAAQNPVSVAVGAIAAHGVATGIAVTGGAYLAKSISERAIGLIGGSLFLVFAATTALGIF